MTTIDRRGFMVGGAAAAAGTMLPRSAAAQASDAGLEQLARQLVAAVNDPAVDEATLRGILTERSFRRPVAEWQGRLVSLRAASGGLDYLGLIRKDPELLIAVRARRNGREARLTAFTRPDAADRLAGFVAIPRPAPYPRAMAAVPMPRAALARAIERRIAWSADRDEFSGAIRVVAPDGAVVVDRAWGRSEGAALTPSWRFHLGSADKSFTALLVARLIDAGRLRFDAKLIDILPDYPRLPGVEAITIEHLLSHRAGLGGLFERPTWNTTRRYDRVAELLPIFAGEPLLFAPGTRAAYSNEGYVVLGAVLERIDGRSWWDQLATHIYAPAGMTRSAHLTLADAVPDRAMGYRYPEADELGFGARELNGHFSGWRGNSCGGGYSTVGDMTAYLAALRAGRLVPPATLARLTAAYPGGVPDYGMGFQVRRFGARVAIGHGGGGPHSGIDGSTFVIRETGWVMSLLGNYDIPFSQTIADDVLPLLAVQA